MRSFLILVLLGWGSAAQASTFAPVRAASCKRIDVFRLEQFLATESGLTVAGDGEVPWYGLEVMCREKTLRLRARHVAAATLTLDREIAFDDIPSGEMSRFAAIAGAQMFELLRIARAEANRAASLALHRSQRGALSKMGARGIARGSVVRAQAMSVDVAMLRARWHEVTAFGLGDLTGSAPGVYLGGGVGYRHRWAPWLGVGVGGRVSQGAASVEAGVVEGTRLDGVFSVTAHRSLGWSEVRAGVRGRVGWHMLRASSASPGVLAQEEPGAAWWAGPACVLGAHLRLGQDVALDLEAEAGWSALTYGATLSGERAFGGQGWWVSTMAGVTWRIGEIKGR